MFWYPNSGPTSAARARSPSPVVDLLGQLKDDEPALTIPLLISRPPAEADMQRFFGVTPASVHRMVIELDRRRLSHRTAGIARGVEQLVPAKSLPALR
jgi:hypothetical protein